MPKHRQEQHSVFKAAGQHYVIALTDFDCSVFSLAGRPFDFPEIEQYSEIKIETLCVRYRDSGFSRRIDLFEQPPDFLPVVRAQRRQISVPTIGQIYRRAYSVISRIIGVFIVNGCLIKARLVKSLQEQPTT